MLRDSRKYRQEILENIDKKTISFFKVNKKVLQMNNVIQEKYQKIKPGKYPRTQNNRTKKPKIWNKETKRINPEYSISTNEFWKNWERVHRREKIIKEII